MIHEIDFFPLCCAMSQPTHTLPYAGIIIVHIPLLDVVAPPLSKQQKQILNKESLAIVAAIFH